MATSSFDKNFAITDPEDVKRFYEFANDPASAKPLTSRIYTPAERERSEQLLKQYLSRSKR